jgi:hypothetical protein
MGRRDRSSMFAVMGFRKVTLKGVLLEFYSCHVLTSRSIFVCHVTVDAVVRIAEVEMLLKCVLKLRKSAKPYHSYLNSTFCVGDSKDPMT